MSTGTQTAPIGEPGDFRALSRLDETVLAMISRQSPLPRTLDTLCSDIEKLYPGMLCSVLLLEADGVTLRSGASPSLPREYSQTIDGVKIGAAPDLAAPRFIGSSRSSCPTSPPILCGLISVTWLYLTACAPAGQHRSWPRTAACLGRLPSTTASREPPIFNICSSLLMLPTSSLSQSNEIATKLSCGRRKTATGPWSNACRQLLMSPNSAPMEHGTTSVLKSGRFWGFPRASGSRTQSNWLNHIHSEDRDIALAAEARFLQTKEFHAEYRMFARDGRVLWFRDDAVLLHSAADDRVNLMQGVLYDITEHKRLEEQLRHSQKLEAVGQLAGGVAHDFNNLLMVIQAHNERLRARLAPTDPASHKDAIEIERAVTRAAALTQQLLAFSRRQVLQLQALDLNSVLTEVAKMLDRLIPANIEMRILPAASPNRVKADPGQMEQVILNLAVNARDAMPQGGRLTIETRNLELHEIFAGSHSQIPPGKYVILTVGDTGVGMRSENSGPHF